ncbi:NAD+ synthase [Sedimenticola hydrogenitrophicus]|uniref:NAD+ synthase n=1 Tax=Sedimenticola hydrogenitrophicus TaxID=2967975 RepID=UPI0023B033F9|nr:NAD+ synthase [Sedimenticola hydrogenitrophicus]
MDSQLNLKISLAQIDLMVGDVRGNADRVLEAMRVARDQQQAHAVIFPELTLTGYPPEDLLLRPELIARVESELERLCSACSGIDLILGYPRCKEGKLYNAAGVIRDGVIIAEYFKSLLPNYSVFDEKRYFEPGDGPCIFDLQGVPVGITICEDIWYKSPAVAAAEAGARILLNLNASPFHSGKAPERETLLQKRAQEAGLSIIYVNLVGGQDELVFDGGSLVVNAAGTVTQRAAFFREDQVLVEYAGEADRPVPVAATIEPLLSEEEAVYSALVSGVRDYVLKNGFKGAVLGLSGGIDSALTLAIAVDALGADQVEVVMMPSRYTADMSNEDAILQAEILGVKHQTIPIEPAFNTFLEMLAQTFAGTERDTTEENIQARCRGVILMAISNKTGKILLTTGNKSEMSVGYSTLYGDMAGGFAPIRDVPKLLVYRLAEYRNREVEVIPRRVIERPPSAELSPDQKDTDSLPAYEILDPILAMYIEQDMGVQEIIAAGYPEAIVRRVTRLVDRNEYKRRQAPPGIKITQRAFGRDRRYPLTNGF